MTQNFSIKYINRTVKKTFSVLLPPPDGHNVGVGDRDQVLATGGEGHLVLKQNTKE